MAHQDLSMLDLVPLHVSIRVVHSQSGPRVTLVYRRSKEGDLVRTPQGDVSLTALGASKLNESELDALADKCPSDPEIGLSVVRDLVTDSVGEIGLPHSHGGVVVGVTQGFFRVLLRRLLDEDGMWIGFRLTLVSVVIVIVLPSEEDPSGLPERREPERLR